MKNQLNALISILSQKQDAIVGAFLHSESEASFWVHEIQSVIDRMRNASSRFGDDSYEFSSAVSCAFGLISEVDEILA